MGYGDEDFIAWMAGQIEAEELEEGEEEDDDN